jgi:hypothetical protein
MNYQISYMDSTKLLVVKTRGKMNADDFIEMAKDLLQHPQCLPDGNVIFDHIALEFNDVSVGDLQKIRTFHMSNEARIGSGKSAIVVKVGLSEEWNKLWSQGEKIKTGNRVQVFESYNEAINWIASVGFKNL